MHLNPKHAKAHICIHLHAHSQARTTVAKFRRLFKRTALIDATFGNSTLPRRRFLTHSFSRLTLSYTLLATKRLFAFLLIPTSASMLFARRRLPALLPQLPCSWETGTLLLGTLFILTCVVAVILGYFGNLDDVCNGYPTNSTSVCPLNQPHEPRRCALGAEVWPNIPVGTFYFPTALTPQCDFMMTTGALAILHCLVLILAAGGCRIRNRNFFKTSYQVSRVEKKV